VLHVAQSLFHDHVLAKRLGLTTVWINRCHDKEGSDATPPAQANPDYELRDLASLADHLVPAATAG
jgi:2-haloacid dehalogenase